MMDSQANDKVSYAIVETDDGGNEVYERDEETGSSDLVATFHPDIRRLPVKGQYGPELANQDCSKIRALTFCQIFSRLVNSGTIQLGSWDHGEDL